MPDDKPHDKKKSTVPWGQVFIWCLVFVLGAILLGNDWDKWYSESTEHDKGFWVGLLRWCYWESFKAGIEPAWRIAVAFGGIYGLFLATNRAKTADEQVEAARDQVEAAQDQVAAAQNQVAAAQDQVEASIKQTNLASRSNQAQRYEKYLKMLWHPKEVGIRIAGCDALMSLGREDIAVGVQCRDLLASFILHSSPTLNQRESNQAPEERLDNIAAARAWSSLSEEWS